MQEWFNDKKSAWSANKPDLPYLHEVLMSAIDGAAMWQMQIDGSGLDFRQKLTEPLDENMLKYLNVSGKLSKQEEEIRKVVSLKAVELKAKPLPLSKTPLDLTLSQFRNYVWEFKYPHWR